MDTDPCGAVKIFSEIIRVDDRSIFDATYRLTDIRDRCAFVAMINLLDLQDGTHGRECRELLWKEIKSRTVRDGVSIPAYDPDGVSESRSASMKELQAWAPLHPDVGVK